MYLWMVWSAHSTVKGPDHLLTDFNLSCTNNMLVGAIKGEVSYKMCLLSSLKKQKSIAPEKARLSI